METERLNVTQKDLADPIETRNNKPVKYIMLQLVRTKMNIAFK